MDFLRGKRLLIVIVILIILLMSTIITTRTSYIKETNILDKRAMTSDTSLLASTNSIANYDEVESSIKEAINNELNTKVNEKSEEAINERVLSTYPIGSIYISTSSTNPSEFIGGKWEAYGQGRTLVGTGTNGNTYTAGSTGGEYEHTITTDELPAHTHSITGKGSVSSAFTGSAVTTSTQSAHTHTVSGTAASAGSHTHAFSQGGQAIVVGSKNSITGANAGFKHAANNKYWYYEHTKNITGIAGSGAHTHTISGTAASAGGHTHTVTPKGTVLSTFTGSSVATLATGGSKGHNNIQPYVVTYIWKRVA